MGRRVIKEVMKGKVVL